MIGRFFHRSFRIGAAGRRAEESPPQPSQLSDCDLSIDEESLGRDLDILQSTFRMNSRHSKCSTATPERRILPEVLISGGSRPFTTNSNISGSSGGGRGSDASNNHPCHTHLSLSCTSGASSDGNARTERVRQVSDDSKQNNHERSFFFFTDEMDCETNVHDGVSDVISCMSDDEIHTGGIEVELPITRELCNGSNEEEMVDDDHTAGSMSKPLSLPMMRVSSSHSVVSSSISSVSSRASLLVERQDADVLFGRGTRSNRHPGNQIFLRDVQRELDNHMNAPGTKAKRRICAAIIKATRKRQGRFLQFDDKSSLWRNVSSSRTRKKVTQAFRSFRKQRNRACSNK
eukprot:CAMPEP_0198121162 /NCGR_PEP_ID=MMETSP1442-20131203/31328_1 /TAXON_ID= /ORGANISM="Craspedostauros australis, Strain CCMP3328" /LENGTH=344 /DNA_ID=CAMNT_0043779929 /DNA_START=176 /DNA_END=1210 /DNA_ORIENTATION=+